eukprot:m.194169 g.194169  ORF g.194169 m.194169 type:complete len:427 (+) comp53696_c0_seq12:56-1336(+)
MGASFSRQRSPDLLPWLRQSTQLSSVNLADSHLDDAALVEVATILDAYEHLETLDLRANALTNASVPTICHILARHSQLSLVHVCDNKFVMRAAAQKDIAEAVSAHPSLLTFSFFSPSTAHTNELLYFRNVQQYGSSIAMWIDRVKPREIVPLVNFQGCALGYNGLRGFVAFFLKLDLRQLTELYLERCDLDDDSAEHFADNFSLTQPLKLLNLRRNQIGSRGFHHLRMFARKCEKLVCLNIEFNRLNDDSIDAFVSILETQTLKSLLAEGNDFTEEPSILRMFARAAFKYSDKHFSVYRTVSAAELRYRGERLPPLTANSVGALTKCAIRAEQPPPDSTLASKGEPEVFVQLPAIEDSNPVVIPVSSEDCAADNPPQPEPSTEEIPQPTPQTDQPAASTSTFPQSSAFFIDLSDVDLGLAEGESE